MKKSRKLIVLLVLVIGALFTNPGIEKHNETIKNNYRSDNPLTGALGGGRLVAGAVKYKNFYIFSLTEFDNHTVSVGLFSKVFVRDLDLKKL